MDLRHIGGKQTECIHIQSCGVPYMNSFSLMNTSSHHQGREVEGGTDAIMAGAELLHDIASDAQAWGDIFLQSDMPSLLIFGDLDGFINDLNALGSAAGFRMLGTVPLSEASARLSMTVDVDAVMLICSGDEPQLDMLLTRLDMMAINNGVMLVIIADFEALDRAHSTITAEKAIIMSQPSIMDISAAMTVMASHSRNIERLNDSSRDEQDARIEKLSDDLNKLTRTIEALVQNRIPSQFLSIPDSVSGNMIVNSPERHYDGFPSQTEGGSARIDAEQVRAVLRARRLRDQILSPDIFADPAWDILLDLMASHLEGVRVSVSSLCIAAAVPPTTALRWIRQLTESGLLVRHADPADGRRIFIALSSEGVEAVTRWFTESRNLFISAAG